MKYLTEAGPSLMSLGGNKIGRDTPPPLSQRVGTSTIPKPNITPTKDAPAPQPVKQVIIRKEVPAPTPIQPPPVAIPSIATKFAAERNVNNTAKYIDELRKRGMSEVSSKTVKTPTGAVVSRDVELA